LRSLGATLPWDTRPRLVRSGAGKYDVRHDITLIW